MAAEQAAAQPEDYVRQAEFETGLSGVSPQGHGHVAADVTDFSAAVASAVGLYVLDGETVTWFVQSGNRYAQVRLKSGGGLAATADGLAADVGPSGTQLAAGNHTHGQLHDALTLAASNTVTASLDGGGQRLNLEVLLAAEGGLASSPSGLAADFGTSESQVARGNHTHAQLHAAATILSSQSLTLSLNGQQITGQVRVKTAGGILDGVDGLYLDLGPSGTQAAYGNHTHNNATTAQGGFMSPEDKQKLTLYDTLAQVDQSALFHRHDMLSAGEYVGGRHRWGQAMQILGAHLTTNAPTQECLLGIEVDGVVQEHITIPGGAANTEVSNFRSFANIHVPADAYVRVLGESGVGELENEPSRIDVVLMLRPSLASVLAVRINAGGPAVSPFSEDQYYSGGATGSSSTTIDLSAVTDPAPQGVYQKWRTQYYSSTALTYTIPGLARGIDYLVRMHFAENYFNAISDQVFHVYVIGQYTEYELNYDVLAQTAGVKFKAVVLEKTVQADSDGQIQVKLQPQPGNSGYYNAAIAGIELLPQG